MLFDLHLSPEAENSTISESYVGQDHLQERVLQKLFTKSEIHAIQQGDPVTRAVQSESGHIFGLEESESGEISRLRLLTYLNYLCT